MMRTWQARLSLDTGATALLDAYAALYGQAERSLFAELAAGKKSKNDLKREYQLRFGITARQFNAIRIGLEGKVRSIQERRPDLIKELGQRVTRAKTVITKLRAIATGSPEQCAKRANKIHQKMRRLSNLEHRRASMLQDQKAGKIRLCFGSRKLFRAQLALQENGYASHAACSPIGKPPAPANSWRLARRMRPRAISRASCAPLRRTASRSSCACPTRSARRWRYPSHCPMANSTSSTH
jgi:hypothetical protein